MGNMDNSKEILIILSGIFIFSLISFSTLFVFLFFRKKTTYIQTKYDLQLKEKELDKMNAVIQAQETERTKIARNLHDEVGSILSMAQRNLSTVLEETPSENAHKEDLNFVVDVLEQSIVKIRTISQEIMPHYLVKFGLIKTLERLTKQTEKNLGNPCEFTTNLTYNVTIDEQKIIQFYTIILELLNNVIKHSKPEKIDFALMQNDNHLGLILTHDGIGINQQDYEYLIDHSDGLGLASIKHRLNLISGEVLYKRQNKGGTINLIMPIN